jgi:patatin-related protein
MAERSEIRLAIVMNGGVSLAIWMGGITAEIDRVRRAGYPDFPNPGNGSPAPTNSASAAGQSATDRPEAAAAQEQGAAQAGTAEAPKQTTDDVWQELLAALGCQVNVDVIAGASAGGLNGSLLAAAIARSEPLRDIRKTWLDVASISKLASDKQNPTRQSVLDGDFFAQHVYDVLTAADPPQAPAYAPWPTDPGEATERIRAHLEAQRKAPSAVTLYTAVTSLHGEELPYIDGTGERFTQREYRVHCRFRKNGLDVDDFTTPDAGAKLGRAARASASFPAAFAPEFFNDDRGVSQGGGPLREGPDMRGVASIEAPRWTIDGGVLNNEPFDVILDEIAHRPLDRDIDRVIAYIVPSVGDDTPVTDTFDKPPGIIDVGLAAMNLPREMNLLNELERMATMASQADADRSSGDRLLARALAGKLDTPAQLLLDEYRERRAVAAVWEARQRVLSHQSEVVIQPQPDAPGKVLGTQNVTWLPGADTVIRQVTVSDEVWGWGLAPADRVVRTALHLARMVAHADPADTSVAGALIMLSTVVIQLDHIRDEFEDAMSASMSGDQADALPADTIIGLVSVHFEDLANRVAPLVKIAVGAVVDIWPQIQEQLEPRVPRPDQATLRLDTAPAPPSGSNQPGQSGTIAVSDPASRFLSAVLAVEVVERACAPIAPYMPVPRFRFQRFGLHTGSPYIADGEPLTDKLFGLRLGHFGAFLRTPWRGYDWMWGRLDGATHLTIMLFEPENLRRCLASGVPPELYNERAAALAAFAGVSDARQTLDQIRNNQATLTAMQIREMVAPLREATQRLLHQRILTDELPWFAGQKGVKQPTKDAINSLTQPGQKRYADALSNVQADIDIAPAQLADSAEGHEVIGEMASAALTALSRDERLSRSGSASGLRNAATVVRLATQRGVLGGILRTVIAVVLVAFVVSPWWRPNLPSSVTSWIVKIVFTLITVVLTLVFLPLMPRWLRTVMRPLAVLVGKVPLPGFLRL